MFPRGKFAQSARWRSFRTAFSVRRKDAPKIPARSERETAVADVRSRLSAALPRFERFSVEGGEKLETLCNESTRLTAGCETLFQVAAGRTDGESLARETLRILREPLAYIDFCHERHTQLLSLLAACEQKTRSMIEVRSRMHATLAPLTYMTVLFKIESATLSEEFRETFANVTTEIDRMRQLVDETFARNAELLASTHATLARVRGDLERDFRDHFATISKRRRQIEDAINHLDGEQTQNGQRQQQLQSDSQIIAAEVSRIVQNLQFQDIVQQKCDHVLAALKTWDEQPPAATAARLQSLQLAGAATDLASGHDNVRTSLDRIASLIARLDERTQSLTGAGCMTAVTDSMSQRLVEAIAEVYEMIRGLAETTSRTHEMIRPAGDLASSLSSTLVELSTNMRLIALNAQIRSVQIGDLTGLETLASRTASISHEIDGVSEESSRALAELRLDLEEMLATFETFGTRGREQTSALAASRTVTENRLHTLRENASRSAQTIAGSVANLKSCTHAFTASLGTLPAIQSELAAASLSLETFSTQLAPAADSEAAPVLETHAAIYTMASERATHAALTGGAVIAATTVEDLSPELFGAEAPQAEMAAQSPTASSNELFFNTSETAAAPESCHEPKQKTSATPAASSLGDNVELF